MGHAQNPQALVLYILGTIKAKEFGLTHKIVYIDTCM